MFKREKIYVQVKYENKIINSKMTAKNDEAVQFIN